MAKEEEEEGGGGGGGEEEEEEEEEDEEEDHHRFASMEETPLEEIDSRRHLKLLMKDWQRQSEGLREQVQHKESQFSRNQTEAFLFFILHILFQGFLLAAVVSLHPDSLSCRSLWAPISISLLSAFPLAIIILVKLIDSENLEIQLQEERSILRDLHGSIQKLRVSGKKFKLRSDGSPYHNRLVQKRILFRINNLGVVVGLSGSILVVFVAFTTVILVSCSRVLCYHGL